MAVPQPPTPVLLYIGAGYDLSPLLTFAPSPPYRITTPDSAAAEPASPVPRTTYTSFLFVDAKPRHTSAFMVPDFDQWIDAPARVRNILRYAQGMLDRWHIVDDDIIWFEGGGAPEHVAARRADPAWRFADPAPASASTPPAPAPAPTTLTTLLYAFNTLDIELARTPALARVWPGVAALYVHGLRPHARTGLAVPALQHVYALVGSWGTRRRPGARHVDFVRAARRTRARERAPSPAPPHAAAMLAAPKAPFAASGSSLSLPDTASPIAFRRVWWDSDSSDDDAGSPYGAQTPGLTTASTLASTLEPAPPPFFSRIPQIAWDERRARYVVQVSVAESLRVWRARAQDTEDEESGAEGADPAHAAAAAPPPPPPPPARRPHTAPPRLRLRPRPPHIHPHTHPAPARRPFWRRAPAPRLDLADFLRGARSCPDLTAEEDAQGRAEHEKGREKARARENGGRARGGRGFGALRALGAFAGLGRARRCRCAVCSTD